MDMQQALRDLGVTGTELSQAQKQQLDHDGFLPLPGVLAPAQIEAITRRLHDLAVEEGDSAGKEVLQELGTVRLSDLVNKDPMFEVCFTHPKVLAAMSHVLRENFKLSSLNARAALPGQGHQPLHVDWPRAIEPGNYYVCNSIWLLDDFTPENGPTRLVPGSHRTGKHPREELTDPAAPHPQEVKLLGTAGTVVIFNSHLWHGGTRNDTAKPRRVLHSYFCRRDQTQQLNQRQYIRPETYRRLSESAHFILDVQGSSQ